MPSLWDERLLRNHAPYLVEGSGGLGMLLLEPEEMLMQVWGQPERRDYFSPERLFYVSDTFLGSFVLYRGRIIEIRFDARSGYDIPESLRFQTALGLTHAMIEKLPQDQAMDYIVKFYKNCPHLRLPDELSIYPRGIKFTFHKGKLAYVDIFLPRRTYFQIKN